MSQNLAAGAAYPFNTVLSVSFFSRGGTASTSDSCALSLEWSAYHIHSILLIVIIVIEGVRIV